MMRTKTKNSAVRTSKRAFTLLELLLACAVITIAAGACAINLWDNYKDRARKEVVSSIQKACSLAQSLSRLSNREVQVVFSETDGTWQMKFAYTFDATLNLNRFGKAPVKLEGVRKIRCEPHYGAYFTDALRILFFPHGIDNPQRVLEIEFRDDTTYKIPFKAFGEAELSSNDQYPKEVYEKEKETFYTN